VIKPLTTYRTGFRETVEVSLCTSDPVTILLMRKAGMNCTSDLV
jgi:hypothetical protein